MVGYFLCFILQPFVAYLGVLKNVSFDISLMWELIFFSMNSLIFTIHDLKVMFVPPLPLSLPHFLHHFIPTKIQSLEWTQGECLGLYLPGSILVMRMTSWLWKTVSSGSRVPRPSVFPSHHLTFETQAKIKMNLVPTWIPVYLVMRNLWKTSTET